MNRFYRDSPAPASVSRTAAAVVRSSQPRRGRPVPGGPGDRDENLELFARTRHSVPAASPPGSDVMAKLGRLSIGSTKPIPINSPTDDLLSSTDGGKHDYDWLLTPPETPLFLSSDANDVPIPVAAPRSSSSVRSVSISKTSKLSATHPENGHPTKPARSSSVTRPSISNIYSTHSNSNRTAILDTSTASVTSSRPATPTSRSTSTRVSVPAARPLPVRSSTPAKTRPLSTSTTDKPRPSHNPRPCPPTSRPQLPESSNSTLNRSAFRPSTPTRKEPAPPRSSSVGRVPPGRVTPPSYRPSSPSPRARMPPQPIVPPDFPLDAPPNLRTTLPDRPVSASRSRPGAPLTVRGRSEPAASVYPPRRQPSPVVSRGRLPEPPRRNLVHSNGHEAGAPEVRKPAVSRPARRTSTSESTGFGRTISKKSLDMALRHTDIRQSVGSIRSMSSNSLYPHRIRPGNLKGRPGQVSDSPSSVGSNGSDHSNGNVAKSPDSNPQSNGENGQIITKLTLEMGIYESSRYESILLKEDLQNTNWLHSVEDKSDQSPVFDHRFEPLPEPFGLI